MTDDEIEDAVRDAAVLRGVGLPVVRSTGTVAETAVRVTGWVRSGSGRRCG
jgi:hypothetical protein